MNKQEKQFLKNIENATDYKKDFNEISNKIVVKPSFKKKNKRLSFTVVISSCFASIILACAIILPILLNNLNLDNPDAFASEPETLLPSQDIEQKPGDGAPSIPNDYSSEDVENDISTNETETDDFVEPEAPSQHIFIYQGYIYEVIEKLESLDMLGEKIGEIDGNEIFNVVGQEELDFIIIKIEDEYYLLEKQS